MKFTRDLRKSISTGVMVGRWQVQMGRGKLEMTNTDNSLKEFTTKRGNKKLGTNQRRHGVEGRMGIFSLFKVKTVTLFLLMGRVG